MKFLSNWITTNDFKDLKPLNMYHKEIKKKEIPESKIKNYHVHFRKKFTLDETCNLKVNISADDYYKLYINGVFVCQGPAAAYPEYYNYNSVDLTPYIKKGKNIIAVHVYYQGLINRVWVSGDNRQGMIADFYKNGEFLFGTDTSWLYSVAKEFSGTADIGYETAFLENIDFNKEEKGWTNLEFDDSLYKNAVENKNADYSFAEKPVTCVDVYDAYPEKTVKIEKGKYFIDFGKELTGQFYMKIKGIKGQKVRVLCGEETKEDSLFVRHEMRCNCNYDEECILSGKEDEFNFYDYKTFRYVNIFTTEDNLNPDSFKVIVRHHKFEEKTELKTDIKYLKDIWEICKNAIKISAQGALVDCPSREKGVYLGDFTVSGLAHLYITEDKEYYKKTLCDFAHTANICPGLMICANGALMQEIADFSLQYPMQLLNYYNYTKDKDTLICLYPTAKGILDYFKAFERQDGLLENVWEKWNIVDWPENLRDNYDAFIERDKQGLDCHNVINAFYIGAVKTVAEIEQIIGINEARPIKEKECAFIKAFYNDETKLFCDTERKNHSALHSNVLPLFFGIANEDMQKRIVDFIMEKGLSCGVYFSYFVLKALGKAGEFEKQLELLTNESEHSWVNMLKEGATTCFEAWGKEQKWNTSLCHPWASAPVIILCEDLNGKFGIEVSKKEKCKF